MKYLIIFALLFASCEKTRCYEFNYIKTIEVTPNQVGYPKGRTVKETVCNISKNEAKKLGEFTSDSTWIISGDTFRETVTVLYWKK